MKFELSKEECQRLFGDKQQQVELLEYLYRQIEKAKRELAKDNDMITKEEIKDHLAHTVYSSGARKTILGYLIGRGVDTDDIEFAKRNCSAREENAKTFEDFITFVQGRNIESEAEAILKNATAYFDKPMFGSVSFREMCEESNQKLAEAWSRCIDNINRQREKDSDFQIGDWVKYMPEPGEESTECIEAIAHGTDGEMYLCLSNGEYVHPCYCVKYKAQGKERRKLIDKLNEVI